MKRYRVLNFEIDGRTQILTLEIREDWAPDVQAVWRNNKDQLKQELIHTYGEARSEDIIKNLVDLGPKPFSILSFHNKFLDQCREAFVASAYYPALTGTGALGERILNHLILSLKADFQGTPEYRRVHGKKSFDNWTKVIEILVSWDALLPHIAGKYEELAKLRHRSIHFDPDTDTNDRPLALKAILLLQEIIQGQFGALGEQPWFIPDTPGESYINRSWQEKPFIRKIYLPNSYLVGPRHTIETENRNVFVHDEYEYAKVDISDDEFRQMRISEKQANVRDRRPT